MTIPRPKQTSVFKHLLVLVIIYWLWSTISWSTFSQYLSQAKPVFLLLICCLYPISLLISILRWRYILKRIGYRLQIFDLYRWYWSGNFLSLFLPTSFGGDIYKFMILKKSCPQMHKSQITLSLFLDRFFGLVGLVILFSIGIMTSPLQILISPQWLLVSFFVLLIILSSFAKRFHNKVLHKIKWLETLYSPTLWIKTIGLSLLFIILSFVSTKLGFLAFSSQISWEILLITIPLIKLAGVLPVPFNGLGTQEGLGVYLYGVFGYRPELILAILLTSRVLHILCVSVGFIFLFYDKDHLFSFKQSIKL